MAVRHDGNVAPYIPSHGPECTWCTGRDQGTLQSDSYNSCVGMVLYGPNHKIGVVSHFSGSMGLNLGQAGSDVLEILRDVCPIAPGLWLAWVFGGISLREKPQPDSVAGLTKPLMNTIRATLKTNPYIPINMQLAIRLANPKVFRFKDNPWKAQELQPDSYVGHKGVRLNLTTGQVTYVDDGPRKI